MKKLTRKQLTNRLVAAAADQMRVDLARIFSHLDDTLYEDLMDEGRQVLRIKATHYAEDAPAITADFSCTVKVYPEE